MAKSKTPARELLLQIVAESKVPLPVSDAITAPLDGKGLTGEHARANASHVATRLVRDGLVKRDEQGNLRATPAGRKTLA